MKILQDAIKGYFSETKDIAYPKCFNNKAEYVAWVKLEEDAHTEPRKFACRDCTSCYQTAMIEANRCHIPTVKVARIAK